MSIFNKIDNFILACADEFVLFMHNQFEISRNMTIRTMTVFWAFFILMKEMLNYGKLSIVTIVCIGIFSMLMYFNERRDNAQSIDLRNMRVIRIRESNFTKSIRWIFYIIFLFAVAERIITPQQHPIFGMVSEISWICLLVLTDALYPPNPPTRRRKIDIGKVVEGKL